jgi:glycosyltransferase involved in cell wall biosynthesis
MRILFVHHYFPGQFQRIARHYLACGHDIVAFHRGLSDGRSMPPIDGIRMLDYGREVRADREADHILHDTEEYIREAASMALAAEALKAEGWQPDLVYSHTGWGTGAFLQDVFAGAKFVKYCEWFYNNTTESTEFLTGPRDFYARFTTSLMNLPVLADLMRADLMIAPTGWQRSQFPASMQPAIRIAPDGVDADLFCPDPAASFTTAGGRRFGAGDRVVTYVARGADPFRGFKPFMEALAKVQAVDPQVEAIVVGDRTVYYDAGQGTEDHFHAVMAEAKIDPARTHFTGPLPYDDYRRVLQVSAVHVYLTVPFVMSWSAFEALSTGCMIVGSDTAPVTEFVRHGDNGLLADFFDAGAIAGQILVALAGGPAVETMRRRARQTIIDRWSATDAVAVHVGLVEQMMGRKLA